MQVRIEKVRKKEYLELIKVWESSVRATHHFLKEDDFEYYKALVLNSYFDAVELRCIKNDRSEILGFSGVFDGKLEMLFIHSANRGKGLGRALLEYSIGEQCVTKVDVDEENKQAVVFYEKNGFEIYGRSELDSSGKPYPILHMKLRDKR